MAPPTSELIKHVESFVDSSSSSSQQAASVDAIAFLLKNDSLTVERLVREMEMYLTTTDNILRARGILLLAEVLGRLASKPLDSSSIHSLIQFFSDRVADWRALHGALVGCMALLKRKSNVGIVSHADAKAVCQSYLDYLSVQSLGQADRKLCYEVFLCLLDRYPEAVAELGDDLVYGICGAIDGEKDPECLMLVFRIVEVLSRLFSDPGGPLASFGDDLFEILGRYFPVHYTHPKNENVAVSRDDLSRALMLAFSSPFFEPFAIPLLLEKLSSSLPLAKIDSLRYLSSCTVKYGPEKAGKHAKPIWQSVKAAILYLPEEPSLSLYIESSEGFSSQDHDIAREALVLLETLVREMDDVILNLVLSDEDLTGVLNTISSLGSYHDLSLQDKQKLLATGQIFSVLVKSSTSSCNRVIETVLPRLLNSVEAPHSGPTGDSLTLNTHVSFNGLNFSALYLCTQILGGCRDFAVKSMKITSPCQYNDDPWCHKLSGFSSLLMKAFSSNLVACRLGKIHDENISLSVKGLLILATFPGGYSIVPKSIFEQVLMKLVSIVLENFNMASLWKLALEALVCVGSFIGGRHESENSESYSTIVVERIVSLVALDYPSVPNHFVLEAVSDISMTGSTFMLRTVRAMEEAISSKLSRVGLDGSLKLTGNLVQLLDCYSSKLLPWFLEIGQFKEILLRFPIDILERIEHFQIHSAVYDEQDLLNAIMMALKLAVSGCSTKDQHIIAQKASELFFSGESLSHVQSSSFPVSAEVDGLHSTRNWDNFTRRQEWLLSLFASVIIAICPETRVPNPRYVMDLFLAGLSMGHVPSAQALGSMCNKGHQNLLDSSCVTVENVLDLTLKMISWSSPEDVPLESCIIEENESCLNMVDTSMRHIHTVNGLAWIGKGLLMRGHEKVKDVIMVFLRLLLSSNGLESLLENGSGSEEKNETNLLLLVKSAADAFHILLSDSEDCLTKRFHAISKPLYKQRLFSILMPVFLSSIMKCRSSVTRLIVYRAIAHVISDVPLAAVLCEAKKIIPVLLDAVSSLSQDVSNKDMVYNLLLVLSGVIMEVNGKKVIIDNAHIIINCLTGIISYPHKMLVRETAIQCLIAMSTLPHPRIYPMRAQVLLAVSKVLDDPKRAVRQEAVRCRHIWLSMM